MTQAQLPRVLPVASIAADAQTTPICLELRGVAKTYGHGTHRRSVLENINLRIQPGEFVALVGSSGSGKTTLISLMAGLITPDAGEVLVNGRSVAGPGPDRGVVFQNYSLMPWMTVRENVALAVDQAFRHLPKAERTARVEKYVAMVGLTPALHKRPAELSGGMRQRVAVARALSANPDILLLDEPLSALDALTRAKLQDEIMQIWSQKRKTVALITNDVDEGILLADRIIPLNSGPGSTLGPEFAVNLPRPRDRRAINHDPGFVRLRKQVTQYLIDVGARRAETRAATIPSTKTPAPRTGGDKPGTGHAAAPAKSERYVEFSQVSKIYPTRKGPATVVKNFDLKIRQGEFISVIGHSGCGKSTALSMMAGLNSISAGVIVLDGKEIAGAGLDRGVVFQAPSLVPWLSAFDNVALGVNQVYTQASAAERRDIVEHHLARVGLADEAHKHASELSNGMKQRVGIARAFALAPKLLLLDEPFGMLDSLTRWDLQEVLMEVWSRTQLTAMMVTHDVDEAVLLADRVIMMTNGPEATIGQILEVNLPRPRNRVELADNPVFQNARAAILDFLHDGAAHRSPATGA